MVFFFAQEFTEQDIGDCPREPVARYAVIARDVEMNQPREFSQKQHEDD